MRCEDDGEWNVLELHDPLAEDLYRLLETWGLATLIHGVKCMAVSQAYNAEKRADFEEQRRLESVVEKLDAAWVDAEGGER